MASVAHRLPADKVSTAIPTALIYTRVSSEDQSKDGMSLPAQLANCRRYVANHGASIGNEYQDVMKGTRDDRPQYQEMLSEVRRLRQSKQQVMVVVAALDRFGRTLLESIRSREEFKSLGVSVHSVRDGGELSDLVANVLTSVAQEEVRRLSERVSTVREHARAIGWYAPGRVPWGYRFREASDQERREGSPKSVLEIDHTAAPYVVEAWRRVASGESVRRVASWVASLPSEILGGRNLDYSSIRRMFDSPTYIARRRPRGGDVLELPTSRWPALIEDDLWVRAKSEIAGHVRLPHQATGRYLLTGLVRCPFCGGRTAGVRNTPGPNNARHSSYRCMASLGGSFTPGRSCQASLSSKTVDAYVLAQASELLETVLTASQDRKNDLRRAYQALAYPAESADQPKIRQLERIASKAQETLRKAARALVDGDIDRDTYNMARDESKSELDAAEAELSRLRGNQQPVGTFPDLDSVVADAGGWSVLLMAGETLERREILFHLIERVQPTRISPGKYHFEIVWTDLGEILWKLARQIHETR